MWRRTKRTVAHRWFWEAITTKASLSPYFRSVPALLVMLEFQGWSRDGSPSPWLATSLWSSLFTLSLLSLSLHCFSSLRRLYVPIRISTHNCVCCNICFDDIFISSVRSSSGYHGLIEIQRSAATFSNFSNSSDSKVKVKVKRPNMSYIFEKHGIQGYRIWHSRVSNVKYTNTRLHKNANTQIQSA